MDRVGGGEKHRIIPVIRRIRALLGNKQGIIPVIRRSRALFDNNRGKEGRYRKYGPGNQMCIMKQTANAPNGIDPSNTRRWTLMRTID
jgi:hypothetical protein